MDILWIFIKTFRKNVLNPEFGSRVEDKMDKHDPDIRKKACLGGLGISLCPTHQGGPFFAQTPDRAYPFCFPRSSQILDLVHFYEIFL